VVWIYNLIFVVVQMVFGVHAVSPCTPRADTL
jgi:hypothetical protein